MASKAKSGHRERLRQRFLGGEESAHTEEALLDLLLCYAIPVKDVRPLAKRLVVEFGSLAGVLAADHETLCKVPGLKANSAALLKLVDWIRSHPPDKVITQPVVEQAPAPPATLFDLSPAEPATARQIKPPVRKQPRRGGTRKTIQDLLFTEGLAAAKLSVNSDSLEDLQNKLMKQLSQNSSETRRRYARSILCWFFADGIDGLTRSVWLAYQDERIETDILRCLYLSAEPVMGACVADALYPLENSMLIPPTYFDRFLRDFSGEEPPPKTTARVKSNLMRLGFLERTRSKPDRLNPVVFDKTSLIILVHYLFAPEGPRTVELRHLLANPFWKYLGCKSEDVVRRVLREADAAGFLGKYVIADQLEQVTTCMSLAELIGRRIRL